MRAPSEQAAAALRQSALLFTLLLLAPLPSCVLAVPDAYDLALNANGPPAAGSTTWAQINPRASSGFCLPASGRVIQNQSNPLYNRPITLVIPGT